MNDLKVLVDLILRALEQGSKTEAEAVAACVELAKTGSLDWYHLRFKSHTINEQVFEYYRTHPDEE